MIDNPFAILERRLNRLEFLLLELKKATAQPPKQPLADRCTLPEALEITALSKSKLYKLTSTNEIPHKRFGNRLIFSRRELLDWIESNTMDKPDHSRACLILAKSIRNKNRKG
jgi:excisionase family DNA binding protein